MKYKNKHIKKSYFIYKILIYIFSLVLALGIFLLLFAFISTSKQINNIAPLDEVLIKYSNPANKTAYLEITDIPQKVSKDKYEGYYLVNTTSGTYISGMQEEQYNALKQEINDNSKVKLEGMTKVIIDDNVLSDINDYLNEDHIQLRVTKITYSTILKEGYLVNVILGSLLIIFSLFIILGSLLKLRKYKHPKAKQIDEECNKKNAIWVEKYKIYLTDKFLVSVHNGLIAIDINQVKSITLYNTERDDVVLETNNIDGNIIKLFKEVSNNTYIYEDEKDYLKNIFKEKNINFICKMKVLKNE